MRNFKLFNGDLVLGKSNHLDTVQDQVKLTQDLKCWLMEPYGTGFLTPNFGSFLDYSGSQGFIGRPIGPETESELRAEIERVISLFQNAQQEKIKLARYNNTLNIFSRKEILNRVTQIDIRINGTRSDAYDVNIGLETANGALIAMGVSTSEEGVNVATS